MMGGARNLKLLIIDDEPPLVKSARPDLELFQLDVVDLRATHLSRTQGPALSEWEQLVGLFAAGSNQVRNFDLLLSDMLFVNDGTAPPYPADWDASASPSEKCPNALGLLHTLAVLAYRKGNPSPFGWAVRSANAGAAKDDPLAIVCYGLIQGLRRGLQPAPNLRDQISRDLAGLRASTIHPTWKEALRDYRADLLAGAREHRFTISFSHAPAEWAEAAPQVAAQRRLVDGAACDDLAHVALHIGLRTAIDRIRIPSLFADCLDLERPERFSPDRVGEYAVPWLRSVAPLLLPTADELWRTWKSFKPGPLDKTLDGQSLVAIAVLLWLQKCCMRNKLSRLTAKEIAGFVFESLEINSKEGRGDYRGVLDKIHAATGGTPTDLAARLIDGTYPGDEHASLRDVGRKLLFEELGWQGAEDQPDFPAGFRRASTS